MARSAKDVGKRQYIGYGVKPPYLSLRDAIAIIKEMYDKAGAELSVESLANLMNNTVASSSFRKKYMALKNFGLVEQSNGDKMIRISNLGMSIVAPSTPNARVKAKKESFLRINTFLVLHKHWEGKILPAEEFFLNTLREKCQVPSELLEGWRDNFIESAQEAGLLQQRSDGKIQVRSEPQAEEGYEETGDEGEEKTPPGDPEGEKDRFRKPFLPPPPPDKSVNRFQIPLTGGKIGAVELPDGWDDTDVNKMIKVIEVMFLPEKGKGAGA
ncbi:MAG: hypothetical protein ACYDAX_02235 [Desulfobacteria bacterium]